MKKMILTASVLLAVLLIAGCNKPGFLGGGNISKDQAKIAVENFVNNNLLKAGTKATIKEVVEEGGLYKVTVTVENQDIITYLTKDGKKFFPQAMDVTETKDKTKDQNANKDQQAIQTEAATKADVPEVKLFVMSYCPYGTQMEKGILPVLDALGSKIKFNLEFVDYSMHGEKELDENLRQYCIEKDQPSKLGNYLSCFLKSSDSESCLKSSGIDSGKLASCVSAADSQFKVKAQFNDKSTWQGGQYPPFDVNKDDNTAYGVQGSPTLVINGAQVSSDGRDPESLLKAVCSGFNNPPAECQKKLSTAVPSPGFDSANTNGADNASSGGSCGN